MTWILILVVGTTHPTTTTVADFKTQNSCQMAGDEAVTRLRGRSLKFGGETLTDRKVEFACVPTGV